MAQSDKTAASGLVAGVGLTANRRIVLIASSSSLPNAMLVILVLFFQMYGAQLREGDGMRGVLCGIENSPCRAAAAGPTSKVLVGQPRPSVT